PPRWPRPSPPRVHLLPSTGPAPAPGGRPAAQRGPCCPLPAPQFPPAPGWRPGPPGPRPPPPRRSAPSFPQPASARFIPLFGGLQLLVDEVLLAHGEQVADHPVEHEARRELDADPGKEKGHDQHHCPLTGVRRGQHHLAVGGKPRQNRQDPQRLRSEEQRLNSSHVKISYAVFCLKK